MLPLERIGWYIGRLLLVLALVFVTFSPPRALMAQEPSSEDPAVDLSQGTVPESSGIGHSELEEPIPAPAYTGEPPEYLPETAPVALHADTDQGIYQAGDTVQVIVTVETSEPLDNASLQATLVSPMQSAEAVQAEAPEESTVLDAARGAEELLALSDLAIDGTLERTLTFVLAEDAPDLGFVRVKLTADNLPQSVYTEIPIHREIPPTDVALAAGEAGELHSADGRVTVRFPSEAHTQNLRVTHQPLSVRRLDPYASEMVLEFALEAHTDDELGTPVQAFDQPLELTVDLAGLVNWRSLPNDQLLYLAYWDEAAAEWVGLPARQEGQTLVTEVDHFTQFGVGTTSAVETGWTLAANEAHVSLFDGALTYEYPLAVPDGAGGLQPNLNLTYSSRRVDGLLSWSQADWAGLGWTIDTMEIVREIFRPEYTSDINLDQTPNWANANVKWGNKYSLLYKGTRYPLTPSTPNARGRYHTEDEQFLYIERRNSLGTGQDLPFNGSPLNDTSEFWVVRMQDGTEFRLGYTEDAEQVFESVGAIDTVCLTYYAGNAPESFVGRSAANRVAYRWRLDRVRDQRGNQIDLTYHEEETSGTNNAWREHASYLQEVRYNRDPQAGRWQTLVTFGRADRGADGPTLWHADNSYLFQNGYLDTVTVRNWNADLQDYETVRAYDLDYFEQVEAPERHVRLLQAITEHGRGGAGTLPATTFAYETLPNKVHCTTGCSGVWRNQSFAYARLDHIDNGYGGVTDVTYATPDTPNPYDYTYKRSYNYRVERKEVTDGMGGGTRLDYGYPAGTADRCYDLGDAPGCDYFDYYSTTGGPLVGYRTVTETLKTLDGTPLASTSHSFWLDTNSYPDKRLGRETETRQKDASGVTLARTVTEWQIEKTVEQWWTTTELREAAFYVYPSVANEYLLEGGGWPAEPQTKTLYQYQFDDENRYGPPTYSWGKDYGRLSTILVYDRTELARQTSYQYALNPITPGSGTGLCCTDIDAACPWFTELVVEETVKDGAGNVFAGTRFVYDDAAAAYPSTPTRGDVARVEHLRNHASDWVTTARYYYSQVAGTWYGPTRVTDALGRETTYTYAPAWRLYPATVTNALSQTVTTTYDAVLGLPTQLEGPNGPETAVTYAYDVFGRLTSVVQPGDDAQYPTVALTYQDGAAPWRIVRDDRQETGAPQTLRSVTYYDGLGRVRQAQRVGTNQQQMIVADTRYNARGLVERQWVPYYATYGDAFLSQDLGRPHVTSQYDALGRVTEVLQPDGTHQRTYYNGLQMATLDANNHQRILVYDGLWRVKTVKAYDGALQEPDWGHWLYSIAHYAYTPLDLLEQVIVEQDVPRVDLTTTIDYDLLGRKVGMDDPDMGAWTYQYDDAGNLIRQQDARGQVICLYYDASDRLLGKHYCTGACPATPPATLDVAYSYDARTVDNWGIGRRTGMTDASGETAWRYDARGRMIEELQTITGSGTFRTGWNYNSAGQVLTETYPGDNAGSQGEVVTYGYDPYGRIRSVEGLESYIDYAGYDALTRLVAMSYGNGANTSYTYYAPNVEGGRLQQLRTMAGSGVVQDLTYDYDAVGNVARIDDLHDGGYRSYTYDSLDRMLRATSQESDDTYSQRYLYNSVGNTYSICPDSSGEVCNNGYLSLEYLDGDHARAVTHVNEGQRYGYDANGNMTSRIWNGATQTLAYDAENHLVAVSGPVTATFVYDGDGDLVREQVGGSGRALVGESYEWDGAGSTSYYYLAGRRVAMRTTEGVRNLHADHLGSTTTSSDGGAWKRTYLSFMLRNAVTETEELLDGLPAPPQDAAKGEEAYPAPQAEAEAGGYTPEPPPEMLTEDDPYPGPGVSSVDEDTQRYDPYGATRSAYEVETAYQFTGQRHEDALGLYFYQSRWYDPHIGRFIQPDTLVPGAGNVEAHNRYSYVLNNPLRYTDPTGHWIAPDTALDIAFIGVDLAFLGADIQRIDAEGWTPQNRQALAIDAAALIVDALCLGLPAATGGGPGLRFAVAGGDVAAATAGLSARQLQLLAQVGVKLPQTTGVLQYAGASGTEGATAPSPTGKAVYDGLTDMEERTEAEVLDLGQQFLGKNPTTLADGVYVSSTSIGRVGNEEVYGMFRITEADITGTHWPFRPHGNYELVRKRVENGRVRYEQVGGTKHIIISP
ncbi:MAG: RHS repeat-associated core domain-containing protein [Anaerolineae bacterium]